MKGRSGKSEQDSENMRGGEGRGREREREREREGGRPRESEVLRTRRRCARARGGKPPRRSRQRKKEGERSGSPALLALRWLKAKESARPRTRPGRDLLPSSFLHPALSPRYARRSLASRGIPLPLPFLPVCTGHCQSLSLSVSLSLSLSLSLSPYRFAIRKQLHHGRAAATFRSSLLRVGGRVRAPRRNAKQATQATRVAPGCIRGVGTKY